MTHSSVRAAVHAWLGSRSWCRLWPAQSGVFVSPDLRRVVRTGAPGIADLTGILRGGKRIEVEIKTGGAMQSKKQRSFAAVIASFGGVYLVARSVDDAREQLAALGYTDDV